MSMDCIGFHVFTVRLMILGSKLVEYQNRKLKEIFSSRMFVPTKQTRLRSIITSRLQHEHSRENVKSNMCL